MVIATEGPKLNDTKGSAINYYYLFTHAKSHVSAVSLLKSGE